MLKKEYRLRKKYMFAYCYKVGKVVHAKSCFMYYTTSKNKNVKIGLSVSKKVGGAVQRNKARRLLREAITPYLSCINNDYNIIIVARDDFLKYSFNDIQQDIEHMLKKAGLLNAKDFQENR